MREKLYILTQEELNFIIIESYQKGQKDGYGDSNFHVSDIKHPEPITVPDVEKHYMKMWDEKPVGTTTGFGFVAGANWAINELLKTKRK